MVVSEQRKTELFKELAMLIINQCTAHYDGKEHVSSEEFTKDRFASICGGKFACLNKDSTWDNEGIKKVLQHTIMIIMKMMIIVITQQKQQQWHYLLQIHHHKAGYGLLMLTTRKGFQN